MSTAVAVAPTVVSAAGGVLSRESGNGQEVLLIHRRRGDWILPKGKLQGDESFLRAAQREVLEETGYETEPDRYLGALGYEAEGKPKVVLFWQMTPKEQHDISDTRDIEEIAWLPVDRAIERLSHDAEKSFLLNLWSSRHPGTTAVSDAPWPKRRILPFAQSRRSYARMFAELSIFEVELRMLEGRNLTGDRSWAAAAWRHVVNAERFLKNKEIDAAWDAFHAARRIALFGRTHEEVLRQADILKEEAPKISGWRGEAMKELLNRQDVDTGTVVDAMAVRDQHFTNKYYEIWLAADQLAALLWICACAVIGYGIFFWATRSHPMVPAQPWGYHNIGAVVLLGLLGAAFSTAQSLTAGTTIPQRMANHSATIMRTIFGTVAGLAGYAFLHTKIVSIGTGNDDSVGILIAVAFIFGYAGDRLVSRVVESLSTEPKRATERPNGKPKPPKAKPITLPR